ncbi:MAG: arsenical pump-driving ATPase, partial [Gemmatimonadales bacterium]
SFIDENVGGTSCLGPLSGLSAQRDLYAASNEALRDPTRTTLVLVSRPEEPSLREAERTRAELSEAGVSNVHLILNGIFVARDPSDATAVAMEARGREALDAMPEGLNRLPTTEIPLLPFELLGPESLRSLGTSAAGDAPSDQEVSDQGPAHRGQAHRGSVDPGPVGQEPSEVRQGLRQSASMDSLVDDLAARGRGVVMTMGKGGVGKTTVAARIALALAGRGLPVTLTTTDPAAHVEAAARELGDRELPAQGSGAQGAPDLRIERIDPELETGRYTDEVMATAGKELDEKGRALLEEELRSPCTEEIAVFRAFAETVDGGRDRFMVIDTAPTGHTLLLLDSAEAYHREVLRKPSGNPEAVKELLPRLRDPAYTEVLLVTLPESTPIHEAMHLEEDLVRAGITPSTWVVNQSLTPLTVTDPVLRARRASEERHLAELRQHASRVIVEPWKNARHQVMEAVAAAPVPGG